MCKYILPYAFLLLTVASSGAQSSKVTVQKPVEEPLIIQMRASILYGVPVRFSDTSVEENVMVNDTNQISSGWLAFGGVLGGAAGAVVGAYTTTIIARQFVQNDANLAGMALVGGGMGLALGAPFGVHLANGRAGQFLYVAGGSVAIGALGTVVSLGLSTISPTIGLILAGITPMAQIGMSMYVERYTAVGQ